MKKLLLFAAVSILSVGLAQAQKQHGANTISSKVEPLSSVVGSGKVNAIAGMEVVAEQQASEVRRVSTAAGVALYQSGFENSEDLQDWLSLDLDGLELAGRNPSGWFVAQETPENRVLVSQSYVKDGVVGNVDDWAISPAIEIPNDEMDYAFSWDARASNASYPDGYEVRIADAELFFEAWDALPEEATREELKATLVANSEVVFTIAKEAAVWTSRFQNINAKYKGKHVVVIWRNNSNDQERLFLDNVKFYQKPEFAASVAITAAPVVAYTIVPEFLKRDLGGQLTAKITNTGSKDILGLAIESVQYKDDNDVDSHKVSVEKLDVGAAVNYTSKGYLMDYGAAVGQVSEYVFTVDVTDADNNIEEYVESAPVNGPQLSTNIYARDNGVQKNGMGVNPAGTTLKHIGMVFGFPKNTYLEEVGFTLVQPTVATTKVNIYNSNYQLVASSLPVTVTPGVKQLYTATFETPLHLMAGTYLVTIEEEPGKSLSLMACTNNIGVQTYFFIDKWYGPANYTFNIRLKVKEGWATSVDETAAASFAVVANGNALSLHNGLVGSVAEVYNVAGQKVATVKVDSANQQLGSFDNGIYIVRIAAENVKVLVK